LTYGIEACALALLRADPEVAVPLSRLHGALLGEAGPQVGPSGHFQERLRRRPDLFILLEPRPAPWDTEEWPDRLRQEYGDALRAAGLVPEPRIVPRTPGPHSSDEGGLEPLLRQLNDTLVDLWDATDDDPDARGQVADALGANPTLRNALAEAVNQPERDRPTTRPRNPRRSG
jgi:hypothetical protein